MLISFDERDVSTSLLKMRSKAGKILELEIVFLLKYFFEHLLLSEWQSSLCIQDGDKLLHPG